MLPQITPEKSGRKGKNFSVLTAREDVEEEVGEREKVLFFPMSSYKSKFSLEKKGTILGKNAFRLIRTLFMCNVSGEQVKHMLQMGGLSACKSRQRRHISISVCVRALAGRRRGPTELRHRRGVDEKAAGGGGRGEGGVQH